MSVPKAAGGRSAVSYTEDAGQGKAMKKSDDPQYDQQRAEERMERKKRHLADSSPLQSSPTMTSPALTTSTLMRMAALNISPRAAGPRTPASLGRSSSPPSVTKVAKALGGSARAAIPRLQDLYELQKVIGQGAYGVVWLAVHRASGRRVAVKEIANVFGDSKEAKRTLREVRLLRHLRDTSPFILSMDDLLVEAPDVPYDEVNESNFKNLYVVTEFMDGGDLSQLCNKTAPGWKPPDEETLKQLIFGILCGLSTIHSAQVLHRDLRPKNLLMGGGTVKIADFGMGRGKSNHKTQSSMKLSLMEFVSNRYYTAPEGLLPNNEYSYPVDVWSIGCIMAEMLLGYNVFRDSRFPDQLRTVINVIGTPTEEDIASIANGRNEKFRVYIRTLHAQEPDRLWTLLPHLSADGKHFLSRLLTFDPNKRATVEEALDHPWLQSVAASRKADVEGARKPVAPFEASDIEAAEEVPDLRRLLWKEAECMRRASSASSSPSSSSSCGQLQ